MRSKNKYAGRGDGVHHKSRYADPFEKVVSYVPRALMRQLTDQAEKRGIPVERLLVRACVNAVNDNSMFDMDLSLNFYSEMSNVEEQQKMYRFLCRIDRGVDLDLLMLAHEEIGLESMNAAKAALSDLVAMGLAELFNKGDYAIPKVRALNAKRLEGKERFKLFAGEKVKIDGRTKIRKKAGL